MTLSVEEWIAITLWKQATTIEYLSIDHLLVRACQPYVALSTMHVE